ncbi:MAG: transglutaminaseTgpA domain-containing protein [Thalassotalea sp.]
MAKLTSKSNTQPEGKPLSKPLAQSLSKSLSQALNQSHTQRKNLTNSTINLPTLWWLLGCQITSLLTVFNQLTTWMLAIIGLCLCWRALMNIQTTSTPSKGVLVLLALSGCVLLVLTGRQLGLLLSMLHLLCFAYSLKSLELKSRKDIYQLSLLGVFILASALIFAQSIYFSIVVIILVITNFILLNSLYVPAAQRGKVAAQIKSVSVLFLQAIPLAIVLFLVFPKLPPLWQVPLAKSASSGLSDSVQIGDIANLAMSDDLAFRADFEQIRPQYQQLYWRSIVLEHFDGNRWSRAIEISSDQTQHSTGVKLPLRDSSADIISSNDQILQYQIYAEPSFQHWLFALDVAATSDADIVQLEQYNLYAKTPITQVKQYQVQSNLSMLLSPSLSEHHKQRNLALPINSNPRLSQKGKQLRSTYDSDEKIISAVLTNFRQQAYFYTLQPPLLSNNSLDQFYFETRKGFCEYYASSFAYLMRAAGIPARVVLGYMGGEYNPNAGYYSIYQRDAHAWTEVWLQGYGWQRVDPTAAVSPERIESGFSDFLLAEQASFSTSFFSAKTFESFALLNNIRLQLAALDYQWTRWVVGYSAKQQINMLSRWFGQFKPWKSAVVLTIALALLLFIVWGLNFISAKKGRIKKSTQQIIYRQALQLLAKKDIQRPKNLSPKNFANLVNEKINQRVNSTTTSKQKRESVGKSFQRLTALFIAAEYQSLASEQQEQTLKQLKQEFNSFKHLARHL